MSCKYEFVKWAGKKIGDKYQGQRVGGAVFKVDLVLLTKATANIVIIKKEI